MSRLHAHLSGLAVLALTLAACTDGNGTRPLPAPVAESVAPVRLPQEGDTVTIHGEHFFEVTSGTGFPRTLEATVCGIPLQDIEVDGEERTLVTPPNHSVTIRVGDALTGTLAAHAEASSSDVVVTRPDGATTTLEDAATCHGDASPVAQPVTATTEEDTPVTVHLSGSDADAGTLTYTVHEPAHGSLSGTPPTLTYTPDPDFSGTDVFAYTASSGVGTSEPATVTISVTPVNDAPHVNIAEPAGATRIEPGDSTTLAATALDLEDGDLTTTLVWASDLDGELGTGATLTTDALSIGTHTVSATVVDADGARGIASVEVWVDPGFVDSGQDLVAGTPGSSVVAGDLDGDRDLDVFVVHGRSSSLLLNDGTGRFTGLRTIPHPSNALASGLALGDLDEDGDLDAYLVGDYSRMLLLNDGTGTFVDSGQGLGRRDTWSDVALGDVDADGDLDAVISSHSSAPGAVYLNDGSGRFTDSGEAVTSMSYAVTLGDVDGDGDPDVVSMGGYGAVDVNDGSGGFSFASTLGTGGSDVALGDLDADGDPDAFIGESRGADGVYLNDGTGTFTGGELALDASATLGVALGDVDGDGDPDAFIANGNVEPNRVYLNDGSGGFVDSGQRLGASSSTAVALADFDGDGKLDAFVVNSDGGSRAYLRE